MCQILNAKKSPEGQGLQVGFAGNIEVASNVSTQRIRVCITNQVFLLLLRGF